jgi:6-pyruvoyltetrahydropterin/6-carboxytetrahydropterin synthase
MEFAASHRVWRDDCSETENREVLGAGARKLSHGHNYVLEVTLTGSVDPEDGMVMDLKRLKDVMESEIGRRFDHRDLVSDTPYFRERPATAENVAGVVFELLDAALPVGMLSGVRLSPTEDLSVEVSR